jgi:hypothetical protein
MQFTGRWCGVPVSDRPTCAPQCRYMRRYGRPSRTSVRRLSAPDGAMARFRLGLPTFLPAERNSRLRATIAKLIILLRLDPVAQQVEQRTSGVTILRRWSLALARAAFETPAPDNRSQERNRPATTRGRSEPAAAVTLRSRTGPSIFHARKSAPWCASAASARSPASTVYQSRIPSAPRGENDSNSASVNHPSGYSGTPRTRSRNTGESCTDLEEEVREPLHK